MPYKGGLARGDTPPKEIPTIGASPRKMFSASAATYASNVIVRDEDGRFSQRSDTMLLDVVRPGDTLRGCPKNYKDYDPSLTTSDIHRAQPEIAHPTYNGHHTMPFKHMQKPPMPEIYGNRAMTHYPRLHSERPCDLSLTTWDVDGCRPDTKGLKTGRVTNPCNPQYTLMSNEAKPSTPPRHSGRDQIAVDDIRGTSPQKIFPSRNEYRDTMKVEDEFKVQKKKGHELTMSLKAHDIIGHVPPRGSGPQRSFRNSDPLNPTYEVPLTRGPPGTSLHVTWDEEKKANKGAPPSMTGTIGEIEGSKPRTLMRDNGEPQLSLLREDLPTAAPMRRIGALPYSMYGPPGNRRFSASLDTHDIFGAQADTLPRGPRMPQRFGQEGISTPR